MIVKVAHLVMNVEDSQEQHEILKSIGYSKSFSPGDVSNPENKKDLMYEWTDLQHLFLYDKDESIPIELIDYGHTAPQYGRYELPSLGPSSDRKNFDNLNIKTSSINLSNQFWGDIGFEPESHTELSYNPPMNEFELTIKLEEKTSLGSSYLDSKGFCCLAFVTTSVESDLTNLSDAGYSTTKIKKVEFSDHSAKVAFITGPCGEIVELITIVD
jgi:hypothetical protein